VRLPKPASIRSFGAPAEVTVPTDDSLSKPATTGRPATLGDMNRLAGPVDIAVGVVALAALTVSTWWVFLGSDTTYQYDSDGVASGPYQAPQVVACVVVLALLTVVGALLLPAWAAVVTVTVVFTVAWSLDAGSHDLTGLWAIGALEVLAGTLIGSGLVAFLTRILAGAPRTASR
jgi:hypothetical protein